MTHTQNTPPDNATDSKVADFWELRPQRVEPQYVGKHRAEQLEPAPKLQWWKYLIAVVLTIVILNGLVFIGAYTPFGDVR